MSESRTLKPEHQEITMADLSLCKGNLATTPYYISLLGVNVYSIEELCFCLVENAYILDEDLMDESMCVFLDKQLKMKELAAKLSRLVREKKSIGEFVTTILTECDYLSEEELKNVTQILLDNAMLSFSQKRKARGDNLLRSKKYSLAIEEYQYVLQNIDKSEETELYGAILHNIGTAYAHMFLFEKAAYYYKEASDLTDNEESRMQYLLALRLTMRKEDYDRMLLRYGFEDTFIGRLEERYAAAQDILEPTVYSSAMEKLKDAQQSGRIQEYYETIDDTLNAWKQEYRKNMTIRSV